MSQAAQVVDYKPGEQIVQHNQHVDYLYVLLSGQAAVCQGHTDQDSVRIGTLSSGSVFGETCLFDNISSSAAVYAEHTCVTIQIPSAVLKQKDQKGKDPGDIYYKILPVAACLSARRLQEVNKNQTQILLQRQKEHQNYVVLGEIFTYVITVLGIWKVFNQIAAEEFPNFIHTIVFNWIFIFAICIPVFLFLRKTKSKISELGVKRENLFSSIFAAVILCCLLSFLFYVSRFFTGFDLFKGVFLLHREDPNFFFRYTIHCYIQEFVARGVVLGLLLKFLGEGAWKSVFISSILFALFHTQNEPIILVTFFIASLLFGFFYLRYRNLAGVSILHYYLGSFAKGIGWM
ncbi:MAG: cyclic nucleotide-binding domain-containing protein [Myxococcota bacterium]